jgi:hypothetical protein
VLGGYPDLEGYNHWFHWLVKIGVKPVVGGCLVWRVKNPWFHWFVKIGVKLVLGGYLTWRFRIAGFISL